MRKLGLTGITKRLKAMGVATYVLDLVREGVKHPDAPDLGREVVARLKETITASGKAVVVLTKEGTYRVFTVEGHQALRASARKNKPWEAATKLRHKNSKKK